MSEQTYGQYQPRPATDENTLPGQNDPTAGKAVFQAAFDDARERTGAAPGEETRPRDERDQYGSLSTLDLLTREAEKEITNYRVMNLPEEYRPGWTILVDCIITGPDLERWTNQSKRKGGNADDIDATKLNARILLNQVKELRYNDDPLSDDKGNTVNFASKTFINSMGCTTGIDAIRKFLWDSHTSALTAQIMKAAGYSQNDGDWVNSEPVDPTHA